MRSINKGKGLREIVDSLFSNSDPLPVGNVRKQFQVSPTITSGSAYANGDNVGGLITLSDAVLSSGDSCILKSIIINDHDVQNAEFDFIFFRANPSSSTITNGAEIDIVDADINKAIGNDTVVAGDYIDLNSSSQATERVNLDLTLTGTDLYVVVVVRGTSTYTDTDHLQFTFNLRQD